MFEIALIVAAALLLVVNLGVWSLKKGYAGLVLPAGMVVAIIVLPCGLMFVLPPVWELAAVLLVLLAGTAAVRRPRLFAPLSLAAFVAVIGGNAWYAWNRVSGLRDGHPFESLADRLPARPVASPPTVMPAVVRFEQELDGRDARSRRIEELHEDTVRWFTEQPNFGVGRLSRHWEGRGLTGREPHGPPVPQPDLRLTSGGRAETHYRLTTAAPHATMHEGSVLDFVHPNGFGYVKDREHVAGFQPHQFSKSPEPAGGLRLRALDLIGLVVHPQPVAYVSANLPRMDELRQNPTRTLTTFEADGVTALQAGDELYAREAADGTVRLVGAIRNAKQCQACHGGRRGELLGAFAYELVRGK